MLAKQEKAKRKLNKNLLDQELSMKDMKMKTQCQKLLRGKN